MSPDTPSIHVIGSGHLGRWLSESIRSTTGHRVADTMSVRGMIDDASEKSDFFTRRQALIDRILEILAKWDRVIWTGRGGIDAFVLEVAIIRRAQEMMDREYASRFLFFGTNGLDVNRHNLLPHVILNSAVKERQVTQRLPADTFGASYFYGYLPEAAPWLDIIGRLPGVPMKELDSRQDYVRERILKTTVNTVCNCASVLFGTPLGEAIKLLDNEGRSIPWYEELGGYEWLLREMYAVIIRKYPWSVTLDEMRARVDATRERVPWVYPSSYGHFFDEEGKFHPPSICVTSDCVFYPSDLIDIHERLGLGAEGVEIPLIQRIYGTIQAYTFRIPHVPFRISKSLPPRPPKKWTPTLLRVIRSLYPEN